MRCLYFCGEYPIQSMNAFNRWAKDKSLSRDVLIHEQIFKHPSEDTVLMAIIVYYDEAKHPEWDKQK